MPPYLLLLLGGVAGYAVGRVQTQKEYKGDQKALPAAKDVIALGSACETWEILDLTVADLMVRKIYIDSRLNGISDPYQLTNRALAELAPRCHLASKGIRNFGELNLYASFYDSMHALLVSDRVYSDAQLAAMAVDFDEWYQSQIERLS